jgi:hypothetical protein
MISRARRYILSFYLLAFHIRQVPAFCFVANSITQIFSLFGDEASRKWVMRFNVIATTVPRLTAWTEVPSLMSKIRADDPRIVRKASLTSRAT